MGYTLGKVGKDRTIAAGRREDAGTDVGKGDRGGAGGAASELCNVMGNSGGSGYHHHCRLPLYTSRLCA